MMKFTYLLILGFFFCDSVEAQKLSSGQIKSKIDSVKNFIYTGPSSDLLPAEFNSAALENEYYCESVNHKGYVFVLRFRDNHAFVAETFYKPYNWARIQYFIGNYRISGDTIYMKYKPLLEGKTDQVYLSPILQVSWVTPRPPDFVLFNKGRLSDPSRRRIFYTLADKLEFEWKEIMKTSLF